MKWQTSSVSRLLGSEHPVRYCWGYHDLAYTEIKNSNLLHLTARKIRKIGNFFFKIRSFTPIPFILALLYFAEPLWYTVVMACCSLPTGEFLRIWAVGYAGASTRARTLPHEISSQQVRIVTSAIRSISVISCSVLAFVLLRMCIGS